MSLRTEQEKAVTLHEGIRGVWRHVRAYKKTIILISVLGFVSAVANGAVPYITGRFFDALIGLSRGGTESTLGFPLWGVLLSVWAFIQIIANNIDWIIDRMSRRITLSAHLGVQVSGFIHLLRLPLSYHTSAPINGELSKLGGAGWRINSLLSTVVMVAPQLLSIVIGITLAASINITLAEILAAGVLLYGIILARIVTPIVAADSEAHRVWNDSWDDAAASVTQAQSVKQAAAEDYEATNIRRRMGKETFSLWYRLERSWNNMNLYQRTVVFLTQLVVFIVAVQFVKDGTITVGGLIALNGYALMFFGPIAALGRDWQIIQNGLTAAGHAERIFSLPEERYHATGAHTSGKTTGEVVFDNVSFRYEPEQADILLRMNFTAVRGQAIAFVGESGVGKSTAISLISGYYFPREGSVLVEGVDTREWDLTALRQKIAVVPQEVALFNDTIRANIRYGTFDASDEDVEQAAHDAHIHDFIVEQPEGYETFVGERGIKLSVGQKQRIAIARAILRNPEFLILDEPTSALDSETERLVTSSLEKLMENRTTFIIAHRLSTVRKANIILVVKDGVIIERGSHDELLSLENGTYRRLYEYHIGLHE